MADRTVRAPAEPAAQQENADAAAARAETALPEVDPAEAASRETADLKDKLLRTLAEMENLRKRTAREVSDARTYGISGFARDVLDIADNLQRALDAVPEEARAAADPGLKALIEGVELTERSLHNALEKNGVRRFDPAGEKFDPNVHQAMYEVSDPSVPAGTVVQVVQPGYMIGERMLRPALVAVAKGGARTAAPDAAANENAQAGPAGGLDSAN